ncbi:SAV_6107 family HEPN domain-containing protein [Actinomycetospora sp. C-140]
MTSALALPGLFDTSPPDADHPPVGVPDGSAGGRVPAPPPAGPSSSPIPPAPSRSATRGATARAEAPAAPPSPPPSRTVVQLLGAARDELRAAQEEDDPAERFRSAHLGALRAAAAVLALRARAKRSSRPTDAWTLLASVAPEYGEWAAFFAAHSATRSAVEAGVRGRVSQRDADDMVRQADLFLALVTRTVAGRTR